MSFSKASAALRALAIFAAALIAGGVAFGQVSTATISGTVSDSSGAVLPHVKIAILNIDTNVTRSLESDAQGRYNAPELPIGTYELRAEHSGFQAVVQKNIQLAVGQSAVVNLTLQVGATTQTVEVVASTETIQTTTSELGSLIDPHQIHDLPLNGRNYNQLVLMAPGVSSYSAPGQGGEPQFSVAGLRPEGQYFLLDGTNVTNWFNQGAGNGAGKGGAGSSMGIDALSEFQVLTDTYGAQYGGNGAIINSVTRSGSNSFHGSGYEYVRNSALDARNFFDAASGPPPFSRNQFGGLVGGPVEKDKAFFFVNYEGLRQSLANTLIAFVPDNNARAGNVPSCLLNPVNSCSTVTPVPVFNAYIQNNILPLYPIANGAEVTTATGNTGVAVHTAAPAAPLDEDFGVARFDYNLSESQSVFARYWVDDARNVIQSALATPANPAGFPLLNSGRDNYLTIVDRKIFSPTLINVFNFGYTRASIGEIPGEAPPPALQWGSTFTGGPLPLGSRQAGAIAEGNPGFGAGGLSVIGDSITYPQFLHPNVFTFTDQVDWTRGAHALRFGFDVRRSELNGTFKFFFGGQYSFANLVAFLGGNPRSMLMAEGPNPGLGLPALTNGTRDFRETGLTPYVQDDWKVTRRLTINIGLRYAFVTNVTDAGNNLSVFFPLLTSSTFSPVPHGFLNNPSLNNWDPRFGFAWDIFGDHKTSLRGGYGIFHDVISQRTYAAGFFSSPPYLVGLVAGPGIKFPNPFATAGPIACAPVNGGCAPPFSPGLNNYGLSSTPYAEEYNINIQRQVFANSVVSVGYVGSRGVHLLGSADFNECAPTVPGGAVRNPLVGPNCPATNPRPNPKTGSLNVLSAGYFSNYNSLQLTFNQRLTKGLDFFASYTYSKALDDASATYPSDAAGYQAFTMNPLNFLQDYGPSSFDLRHNFISSLLYELPFDGNRLKKGWQVSLISSLHTGEPYTTGENFDWANTGTLNIVDRPDVVGNPNVGGPVAANPGCAAPATVHNAKNWINPCALVLQPAGTFGTMRRDSLNGPGYVGIDFSIIKDTRITERTNVQFRAEFFNIINHANLGLPGSPAGGGDTFFSGATPGGVGIFTPGGNSINNTGFNNVMTSRQIQFGVKLAF